jgi:hypothetical protein
MLCALRVLELELFLNKIQFFGFLPWIKHCIYIVFKYVPGNKPVCVHCKVFFNAVSGGTHLYIRASECRMEELFDISPQNYLI